MAEGVKKGALDLKVIAKIVVGIALIALGVILGIRWWLSLYQLIQGCIPPFLVLMGLVFMAIAKD